MSSIEDVMVINWMPLAYICKACLLYSSHLVDANIKVISYGVVLKRRNALQQAATALLKSLSKYQFNWSAWMELATLVYDTAMVKDENTCEYRRIFTDHQSSLKI
jgi:hypothetical protein